MGETGGRSKDVTCCFVRAKKDVLLQLVEDRLNSSAKMNANERSNHTEGQQSNNNKEKKTNQQRFAVIPLTIGSVLKGPAEALK